MKNSIFAAVAAMLVLAPGVASAQSQTRYFARSGLPKPNASVGTPAAGSKTLLCSGLTTGKIAYPEVGSMPVQGPIKASTSAAAAFEACNELGRLQGEAYKTYNNCRVAKQSETLYYSWFVRASGIYDYGNDPYAHEYISNATCTYYP